MREPKISVVIPTRERCDVLYKTLQTVTAQDYENLEIIVSDNCSSDLTKDLVLNTPDKRVKYINTGKRVSMSHNWEFALSHVKEGWVTIIGDDDGLTPSSLNKVSEIIQVTDCKAIRSSVCYYEWPSLTNQEFGLLKVPQRLGFEVRDSRRWLSRVMNGLAPYPDLPMLYNGGFVNIALLKEIKKKTGSFYKSFNPDIYSAIAFASVIDNYIYSWEPLAINGASKHSTGTSSFSTKILSEESPSQIFTSEKNIPFHSELPLLADGNTPRSIHLLVYESYLQFTGLTERNTKKLHTEQLENILATTTTHEREIKEWGKLFATNHELDFRKINFNAARKRFLYKLFSFPKNLARGLNTYHIGSTYCPIKDVYDASVVAGTIMDTRPSRRRNLNRLLKYLVPPSLLS